MRVEAQPAGGLRTLVTQPPFGLSASAVGKIRVPATLSMYPASLRTQPTSRTAAAELTGRFTKPSNR
jgi:hypothetical protein